MKMLVNRNPLNASAPFNLESLKLHLRVDGDHENTALETIGFTAAQEIEHFAQIALLDQTITVTVFNPAAEPGMNLPIGPVQPGETPTVLIEDTPYRPFDFVSGLHPYIRWHNAGDVNAAGKLTISYRAGFGAEAQSIPKDLSQALLDQAALHYDGRSPMDAKSLMTSPHMARIGAKYRGVRA
jgi:uncharacterized phiE125 gp8 family phage protein